MLDVLSNKPHRPVEQTTAYRAGLSVACVRAKASKPAPPRSDRSMGIPNHLWKTDQTECPDQTPSMTDPNPIRSST